MGPSGTGKTLMALVAGLEQLRDVGENGKYDKIEIYGFDSIAGNFKSSTKDYYKKHKEEVDALMSLLVKTLHAELPTLNKNSIRLHAIGRLHLLPEDCQQELQQTIELTKGNSRLNLVLALSYSSKSEITDAVKEIAASVTQGKISPEQVNEELIQQHLYTRNIPDPELMIRSSGEHRISNFLLWQLAYAELYFTDKLWPEITRQDFYDAIVDFQKRERRFGMTTEQIQ